MCVLDGVSPLSRGVLPFLNADDFLMSNPTADVMRRRDGDETHTPKPVDAMATPHLSGSDENQNQVTQEQKQHWGSTGGQPVHQSTRSNTIQSKGCFQSANMMADSTGASAHSDAHGMCFSPLIFFIVYHHYLCVKETFQTGCCHYQVKHL